MLMVHRFNLIALLAAMLFMAGGCAVQPSGRIFVSERGSIDGERVTLWTIDNGQGVKACVMDYGATLVSLEVDGRRGETNDLVFGADGWQAGLNDNGTSGAITDGHPEFERRIWAGTPFNSTDGFGVRFRLTSPAGESGRPGRVDAEVDYVLTVEDELRIVMKATAQSATAMGMAHRGVWKLSDQDSVLVNGNRLKFDSNPPSNGNASEYFLYGDDAPLHLAATVHNASDDPVMSVWTNQPVLRMETTRVDDALSAVEFQTLSLAALPHSEVRRPDGLLVPGESYRHVVVYRLEPD